MLKMFNVPNIITAGNLVCGIFAILFALFGKIDIAPYFIFLAAVLDFLDGLAARLLKQYSELGKQLDSLADMVSFGLAPGIIMMVCIIFSMPEYSVNLSSFSNDSIINSDISIQISANMINWKKALFDLKFNAFIPFVALLIPVFSMFRLAKFNLDTRQTDSFIGVPTPANTLFFMTFPLVLSAYFGTDSWSYSFIMKVLSPTIISFIIVVMSFLLLSEMKLISLKFKNFKFKGNEVRYIFLFLCLLSIVFTKYWCFALIIVFYVLCSLIQNGLMEESAEKEKVS